jgi:DNA-binding protein Fis
MYNFITKSPTIHEIIKGLELTKELFVSSIIIGEAHTGKKGLINHLFSSSLPRVSAYNQTELEDFLNHYDELIITDFEQITNTHQYNFNNKKIIATANYITNQNSIDDIFAFIYNMPSLKEREEDIEYLSQLFLKEASSTLMVEKDVDISDLKLDLSQNTKSLKKSIYRYVVIKSIQEEEIRESIYHFLYKNMGGNNAYKEYLELYEKPLIEAGLKKYHSQLKLSSILGINRNTLRKKILEHKIDV